MTKRISRRQALATFGTVSLGALLAACGRDGADGGTTTVPTTEGTDATVTPQTPSSSAIADLFDDAATCVLTPEQTEGPYYFNVDSIRSDVREDRAGTVLRLGIRVQDAAACTPLPNAVVDVWHCDAGGVYSGFESASTGGGGGPGGGPTDDETYLRGAQVTNADGIVEFATIYPGWYTGRTVHIHTKVHVDSSTVLTTQLYFDEATTDAVHVHEPYSEKGQRDTRNEDDMIFDPGTTLTLLEDGDGFIGVITFGVDSV